MNLWSWLFGPPSRDQFAKSLMNAFRQSGDQTAFNYDQAEFRLTRPGGGEMNLGNLYSEHCQLPPRERKKHLNGLVQIFAQTQTELPESFEDARAHLRPKIWPRATFANLELRQQIRDGKPLDTPLYPLGEHLLVGVVYDEPASIRSLSNEDLARWGITYYEAMEIASRNLEDSSVAYSQIGEGFYSAVSGDNYDAARILLKDRLNDWQVNGDYVAMIPQRDAMYVTGSNDEAGMGIMIDLARQTLKDQPRPISPLPLRLLDGEWEDWTFPETHPRFEVFQELQMEFFLDVYGEQKSLLEALHQKEEIDIFVASFTVVKQNDTGKMTSYCVWGKSVHSLLPKTDLVIFASDGETKVCEWDRVVSVCGRLMHAEPDLYPVRYVVSDFPTDDQLERIGSTDL